VEPVKQNGRSRARFGEMAIGTGGEAVRESNTGYVVCNIRLAMTRQQIAFESIKLMPTTYESCVQPRIFRVRRQPVQSIYRS